MGMRLKSWIEENESLGVGINQENSLRLGIQEIKSELKSCLIAILLRKFGWIAKLRKLKYWKI